jgi:hypothetical protein
MRRHAGLTNRCCKLVADQLSTRAGNARRRQQISQVIGDRAQPQPHLVGAEAVARNVASTARFLCFTTLGRTGPLRRYEKASGSKPGSNFPFATPRESVRLLIRIEMKLRLKILKTQ